MIKDFKIKRNDLQPYYRAQLKDADGNINLTGASVIFTLRDLNGNKKVDGESANITDNALGYVEYRWSGTDTDTIGEYRGEFQVSPSGSGKFTLPIRMVDPITGEEKDGAKIFIVEDLDDA